MPTSKTTKKAPAKKATAKKAPAKKLEVKSETPKPVEPQVVLPLFDGSKVRRVLTSGHTKTQFHCKMEDETTKHVPRGLFE